MNPASAPLRQVARDILRRPTLMLLTFSVAAQLVSVVASPLLTRLYSPEAFGVLGAITAIVMVCVPLATGRYELALPGAKSDEEALTLLRICMVCALLGSAVFAGIAWAASIHGPTGVAEVLARGWYFIPLGIVCVAAYDTLAIEASRQNNLRPLAWSKLQQAITGVGAQITFGWLGWTSIGLLLGFLLNQASGVGRLFKELVAPLRAAHRAVAWADAASVARKYKRYPLFASWTQAFDLGGKWALQFAFAVLWSAKIGGFIFLTDRLVARPLMLLSGTLLPVYVADVSRALRDAPGEALRCFYATLGRQSLLAAAWVVATIAAAPFIVEPLFGSAWVEAIPYVQVTTLAIAPMACLHAVAHTLQITGCQRLDAALSIGKLSMTALVLALCHSLGLTALHTLIAFAASQAAAAAATFVCYRKALRELASGAGVLP